MQKRLVFLISILPALFFISCKSSSSAPPSFCDTACLKDSLKFTGDLIKKPTVVLTASACHPDTIAWSVEGMGVYKKLGLEDTRANLNKDYFRVYFDNPKFIWVLFNDCNNGRGYSFKLPYDKDSTIGRKAKNVNNLDRKYSVADNLSVYLDPGNIFVEDMSNGKKAMMTFGENLGIDYDALHEYIDSVNITNSRIWARVKKGKEWKEMEKAITLQ